MLEINEYLEFAQAHGFASLFDKNDQSLDQHSRERLLGRATARPIGVARYSYAIPDLTALNILAQHGPIVEIGAGTGYWAHLLRQRGVDVVAFDINPPLTEAHTNHYHKNELIVGITWTEVLIGGPELAAHYPEHALFLCWPPPCEPMAADALAAYKGSTVIFIGEWNPATAADVQFYDALEGWQLEITHKIPRWFGIKDRLSVWRRSCRATRARITHLTRLAQQAEKVALSASTLEKRFGLFRPTAKVFLEAHQQEVEQHNQSHAITAPAHNRSVPDVVWDTLKEQAR